MMRFVTKFMTLPLLFSFLVISALAPVTEAKVIDTQALLANQSVSSQADIQNLLERADVREQLVLFGVDPDYASERVAALTDQELQELQGQIDNLPAGGDALAIVGAVFLVLLILELVGVTNIFTKI